MPKPVNSRFKHSVKYMVRIRTDRPHGWKHHFRGVVSEVISYLEFLAKRDDHGEWFVWAQVDDIVKHTKRYGGDGYSRAAVEKALGYLRQLRIVSGVVERTRWNMLTQVPQTFTGRIVTPHHVLCDSVINGKFCKFNPHRATHGHKWAGAKQTKNVGRKQDGIVIWYAGPVSKKP